MKQIKLSSSTLILLVAAFIFVANNSVFFSSLNQRLDLLSLNGTVYIITFSLLMMLINALLFFIVGQKYLLKPLLVLFLMVSAIMSYFTQELGVIFDVDMIRNIAETVKDNNKQEALELLSAPLIFHVFLFGILPSLFVLFTQIQYKPFFKEIAHRLLYAVGLIILTASLFMLHYKYMTFFSRENNDLRVYVTPIYPALSLYRYIDDKFAGNEIAFTEIGKDAKQYKVSQTRTIGIMVVGETARADHFSLNGYSQETNPLLKQLPVNNFSQVSSCGTSTAYSVPCMFSFLAKADYSPNKAEKESNVLDVLSTAGVKTVWLDNNSSCKGVCKRIETMNYKNQGEYYDDFIIDKLDQYIDATDKDILIVFHSFGSHGPSYYKRYPETFAKFTPFCKNSTPQECNSEEIINAYDNTILYTDFVLNGIIEHLKQRKNAEAFLFYASDHGESLGENGVYLHGLPYFIAPKAQTHIPMLSWFSDNFTQNHRINLAKLKQNEAKTYSHDNISHSLLGLFNVTSEVYQPDLDLFQ